MSETSSVSHIEDLEKVEQLSSGLEHSNLEAHCPEQPLKAPAPTARQTEALQNKAQHPEDDHSQMGKPGSRDLRFSQLVNSHL